MKNVTLFAIMTAATALIASPVLAQTSTKTYSAKHMRHHASSHMNHHANAYHHPRHVAYRNNWNGRDGNWPGAVAAGVVGGAVGTAAAVATAPFGGPGAYQDSYAYGGPGYGGPGYADSYSYDGTVISYSASYAARNGFVCRPGTVDRTTGLVCQ